MKNHSAKNTATGTVHKMPEDLRQALVATPAARAVWKDITPPGTQ